MEYQDIRRTLDATDNATERDEDTNVEQMETEKECAGEEASAGVREDDEEDESVDREHEEITPSLNHGRTRKIQKAEKTQHTTRRNLSKLVDFVTLHHFW